MKKPQKGKGESMKQVVRRVYVEKRPGFQTESNHLMKELKENLHLTTLNNVRTMNCYDVQGLNEDDFMAATKSIFSEPNVDFVHLDTINTTAAETVFGIEYLPGQFDQRADSAAQCVQLLTQKEKPLVRSLKVVVLEGNLSTDDINRIKKYMINPVDSHEADLIKPNTIEMVVEIPADVMVLSGFISKSESDVLKLKEELGLAMSLADFKHCQTYFKSEERDPSITEIRAIDTYWSDHCRHTTFLTHIDKVTFEETEFNQPVKEAYEGYMASRELVYGRSERAVTLMDIAVIGMKEMKKTGQLDDLDESEEINACSIKVPVDVDGKKEDWLVMFKNETHNHPTEIEPFGGAATCLGGAIRDPLSGRSYVYQAMRVTGSADPRTPIEETLSGKLPQRTITVGAAHGYSSYGNQIGLATGQVEEYYHPRFVAKRMEVGAVIAAAPSENVVREQPATDDVILLVGGRTGRDGCGGATGSSKEHDESSILECGAEVQKGNAPTERKIQRLFRNSDLSKMIKRCNDFGAGGVSVAIGELADSIDIELDRVPKKYDGLDGTELAISESQERMAVVIDPANVKAFMKYAEDENLEATEVAKVTDSGRLRMFWRGNAIMDISRTFLDSNGVSQHAEVYVEAPDYKGNYFKKQRYEEIELDKAWGMMLKDLNVTSKQGLVERFDSTVGAGSVVMPFGGKHQKTPVDGMVGQIPVLSGHTNTGTIMTHGYDPYLASWSPYHGSVYALLNAMAKTVALGGVHSKIRYSLQEYFEKLGEDPARWGKPFGALLGAHQIQKAFGTAAIGGKDSMSGTFKDIDVPPTLVAFAVSPTELDHVVTPEFKSKDNAVYYIKAQRDQYEVPDLTKLNIIYSEIHKLVVKDSIASAKAIGFGGLAETVSKMSFGNRIGMQFTEEISANELFEPAYGSLVIEVKADTCMDTLIALGAQKIGTTSSEYSIKLGTIKIDLEHAQDQWESVLDPIFPKKEDEAGQIEAIHFDSVEIIKPKLQIAKPRVVIPVFPGTNCEYDTARAFEKAGAQVETLVFKNLKTQDVEASVAKLTEVIKQSQIIALPGGFSAGDEPDGSGKFIATVFRNPRITEAVMDLLNQRDGLMLGICNGFQALIKLGLVPYGDIRDMKVEAPTLTYNNISRHVSSMAHIKIASNRSPWLQEADVDTIYQVPLSHGEGRFTASAEVLETLIANGQVATRYVDLEGNPTYDGTFNPNGSLQSIEGITSPDGRIYGKMGHSERIGPNLYKNVIGEKDMKIFEAGVKYFK